MVSLPIGMDALGVVAKHFQGAVQDPLDPNGDFAKPLFERGGFVRERGKHQATQGRHTAFLQAMVAQSKVLGQPPFASESLTKGRVAQVPFQGEAPGVVDAVEFFRFTKGLSTHHVAAVRAAVHHHIQAVVVGAGEHHRLLANVGGLIVAWVGDFNLQADIVPVRSSKDVGLFIGIGLGVQVNPVGRSSKALFWPGSRKACTRGACGRCLGLRGSIQGVIEWAHGRQVCERVKSSIFTQLMPLSGKDLTLGFASLGPELGAGAGIWNCLQW